MKLRVILIVAMMTAGSVCKSTVERDALAKPDVGPQQMARVASGQAVYVRYLGAGGALIRFGDRTIMTAPYFSGYNERLALSSPPGLCLVPLRSNYTAVDRNSGALEERFSLNELEAVFVGHAHYDHLLDVPRFVRCFSREAIVYGSSMTGQLLAQESARIRQSGGPECKSSPSKQDGSFSIRFQSIEHGDSFELPVSNGSRFRIVVKPLLSDHAPHFHGIDLLEVCSAAQLSHRFHPPRTTCDWRRGRTYAYVFELYDGNNRKFRIYHNDASATPGPENNPAGLTDSNGNIAVEDIDVAILTLASYTEVRPYPEDFIKHAKPRHLIMSHWEDFFQEYDLTVEANGSRDGVPSTDVDDFLKYVDELVAKYSDPQKTERYLPEIGAEFVLE